MPILLPTPEEMSRLSWHKRDKVIRACRTLMRAYGEILIEDMTQDGYRPAAEARAKAGVTWGESVRAEARRLAGEVA